MKKAYEFLSRHASSKAALGALAFMMAYITGGSAGCPFCGGQGVHPWEWGVTLGV